MAAGSAGDGAGSNTELRWTFSRLVCQSEMALAPIYTRAIQGIQPHRPRSSPHSAHRAAVCAAALNVAVFRLVTCREKVQVQTQRTTTLHTARAQHGQDIHTQYGTLRDRCDGASSPRLSRSRARRATHRQAPTARRARAAEGSKSTFASAAAEAASDANKHMEGGGSAFTWPRGRW